MFGHEAIKLLNYGECYPDGFKIGTGLSQECNEVKKTGFPMWVINGQLLEGFQDFPNLAKASGFEAGEFNGELAKLSAEANMQP
ncbi:hypothetical protein L1987_36929 [Smallanthus sonchifolius]|uniref:Uncharacterized protein n=1 Tax=Smallanthus sonchifolius TaxID=185202 RepID=A0ACB9HGR2_9ASTR|nr:hypothetical protein L1987_36929 [Smallanthus sonchifolius]